MPEEKKKQEETKVEQTPSTTPEKKKSNTVLYIVLGAIVLLGVISIAAYMVIRGLIKKGVDSLEEGSDLVEQISDDFGIEESEDGDSFIYKASTEEKVDGELEKENLVSSRFPDDIPLCGGIVTASSYDEWNITTKIETASTPEEVLDWYETALQDNGWEITGRESNEMVEGYITASMTFESTDQERRGEISIDTNPFYQVTSVTIKEILY